MGLKAKRSDPWEGIEVLPARLQADLRDVWPRPCVAAFKWLAAEFPSHLVKMLGAATLRPIYLAMAVDASCKLSATRRLGPLPALLSHPHAMVREAAVDALGAVRTMISEQDDRAIVEMLCRRRDIETSPGVIDAINDVLYWRGPVELSPGIA